MTPAPALLNALIGKKMLIFDFDGTVADTSLLHAQAFADTLVPLGLLFCYPDIAGMRTSDAILHCYDYSGINRPSPAVLKHLVLKKQQRVRDLINISLQPSPLMDEFLQWSKSRFFIALVTSGSRATVTLALNKLGYASLFRTFIFAEDVKLAKPDPEGLLLALHSFDCRPEEVLVFEDSAAGFTAASKANLQCINIHISDYALSSSEAS